MFFTKIGRVIAWLAFVFGALRVVMGFLVATITTSNEAMVAASKRYLSASTSGEAIDAGVELLVFGVAIGILVEISLKIGRD